MPAPLWLRSSIFTILVPGTVAGLVPYALATSGAPLHVELGGARWLGLVPLAAGLAIYISTVWQFGTVGHGTPAPWDPPRGLVRSGLHAHMRNPMYLGVLLLILGEACLAQSGAVLIYALVVWAAFHTRVLVYQEPTLRRLFGAEFDAYCARVPRWVPRSMFPFG